MGVLKIIFEIILGLAIGVGVVFLGEMLNHQLWPPPAELNVTNPDAVRAYLETAPLPALIGLPLVWTVATGLGAFAATKVASHVWAGWLVGALLFAATALNLAFIPHPLWMLVASVTCVPLAGLFGAQFGRPVTA